MTAKFKDTGSFERVACVTLKRRDDRWSQFVGALPGDWPFKDVERYDAIDGKLCQRPDWWKQGGGAWGCYRSHVRILEECLNNGVDSCLFLEDDAIFAEDFTQRWRTFFEAIPDKQDCFLYLGGQHLHVNRRPPFPMNPEVYVPYNVNRTHAFALVGRKMMVKVYKHLEATPGWRNKNHIDHHLGRLHQRRGDNIYCPRRWLVGQREGKSNIAGRNFTTRFWPAPEEMRMLPVPFTFVMGTHRSGSSCMAMVLHKLGVHMGNNLGGYEDKHGGGGEAQGLAQICEQAMPFPTTELKNEFALRRDLLNWMRARCQEAIAKVSTPGAKYPHLAAWGPMLEQLTKGQMRVVHIHRPVEESVESLQRRNPGRNPGRLARLQRWLYDQLGNWLSETDVPVHHVEYSELLEDTEAQVNGLVEFLGLRPTEDQLEAAVSHPQAAHRHVTTDKPRLAETG